jgi:hypothetical protein
VLLTTRAFVGRMSVVRPPLAIVGLLLANVLVAAAIALGALLAFKAAVVGYLMCARPEEAGLIRSGPAELWALARADLFPLSAIPGYWSWGIWFYAAFFAPALAWLYAVAGAIVRLTGFGHRMAGTGGNPLRGLGLVAIVVVSVLCCVLLALR